MKKYVCTVCNWIYDPAVVTQMAVSLQVLHSKLFQMIGLALSAVSLKKISS